MATSIGRNRRSKKRSNGEGSIFKEASGRYRISVTSFVNGRRFRKTKTAWSNAEAVAILAKLRGEPIAVASEKIRLSEWLERWLNEIAATRCEATTVATYRWSVDTHIKPRIGEILLDKLRPLQIQNWLAEMIRDGVGSCARESAFIALSGALKSAVNLEIIQKDPSAKIRKPKRNEVEIDPFTLDEAKAIIKAATGTRNEALVMLALTTGMRQGELFAVRKSSIDWNSAKVRVDLAVANIGGARYFKKPKTKSSERTVSLTADCLESLKRHSLTVEGDLMFTAPMGGVIDRCSFRGRVWRPLLKQAGVRYRPLHHARHAFATLAIGAGAPITVVSQMLGHSKVSTTLDIYSHVLENHQTKVVETVAQLFG